MRHSLTTQKTRLVRYIPSGMASRRKGFIAAVFVVIVALLVLLSHLSTKKGHSPVEWVKGLKDTKVNPCPDKIDWLNSLNIAFPVSYARRDIQVNRVKDLPRKSVSRVKEALLPEFQSIDLSEDSTVHLEHCKDPLRLDVPNFPKEPVDGSHLIFGISTTLDRVEGSIPNLLRWLPHTRARLFMIVIESEQHDEVEAVAANRLEMGKMQTKLRDLGMDVTLVDPVKLQDSFSEKYFSLLKIMYDHRDEHTAWISTIDDDTFFPSMPALIQMLAKYDSKDNYYVGALSEDWWSVTTYGMMAFGGAGVFLSIAMAKLVNDNYDLCKETSHTSAGDIRILECVSAVSTAKLTNEPDLHQVDIWTDLSGLYENGRLPLSLHHWKPGPQVAEGIDVPAAHLVSDVCRECFLQRWWFDEDMLLSNGYSVSFYPKGDLPKVNLDFMEMTWSDPTPVDFSFNHGNDHSLGPTRPKLELDDRKIQYRLIASEGADGGVRQAYLHKGVNGEMDSLIELFWFEGHVETEPSS